MWFYSTNQTPGVLDSRPCLLGELELATSKVPWGMAGLLDCKLLVVISRVFGESFHAVVQDNSRDQVFLLGGDPEMHPLQPA